MQHATGGPEEQMFQTWALEGISKLDMINDKSDLILSSCCFNVLDSIYPRHSKGRTNTYQNNSSGQLFATIFPVERAGSNIFYVYGLFIGSMPY